MKRIKIYEEMSKEELIISLLKSKQSNNNNNFNFDDKDDKISDIKKIFNRLRYATQKM